jgi:hypothetical protein
MWTRLRNSERIFVCYFIYTAALSLFLPLTAGIRARTWIVNALVIAAYAWV